jgi:hypothetical protein
VVLVSVMMIGRWSDESEVMVFQSAVRSRFGVASDMSGEVVGPPGGARVGELPFSIPNSDDEMASHKRLPLGSWVVEYHSWW